MVSVALDWIKQPLGICRIIAFGLSVVVLGLFFEYDFTTNHDVVRLSEVVCPSTCVVLGYFLLSYIVDDGKPGKHFLTELIFDLVHAILNVVIGGYAIDSCDDCDGVKSFGAMTIILAVVLLIDAFLSFKKRE